MKNRTLILGSALAAGCLVAGCDNNTNPGTQDTRGTNNNSTVPAADNTARNERDRSPTNSVTPIDQGMSSEDTRITSDIRKAVMDDSALSTNAKNCKIITNKGVVTLRGPVTSDAERTSIAEKARAVAGVVRVDNELEVVVK